MSSEAKVIRGQVRQIVKEEMPAILQTELAERIRKELTAQFNTRFTALATHMQKTMDAIEERSKEVQAYVIRQSANKP